MYPNIASNGTPSCWELCTCSGGFLRATQGYEKLLHSSAVINLMNR